MNSRFLFSICLIYLVFPCPVSAQIEKYNLGEIISLAQGESPQVKIEKVRLSNAFWRLQSFKADLKPRINLNATLPNLNRTIDEVVLPTGASQYLNRSQMNNNLGINLSQSISATGGTVFAATGLSRLDIFKTNTTDANFSYRGQPFYLGFSQPISGYNSWKWEKQLRPLEFEASKKIFSENKENIASQVVALYFDLLLSQLELNAISKLKSSSDTLYLLNKSRFEVGKIAETELLQSEINLMNTDVSVAQSKLQVSTANERLRNFLGLQRNVEFELVAPDAIPEFIVTAEDAIDRARKNRSEFINQTISKLNAESNLDRARRNKEISFNGTIGFTQTGKTVAEALSKPLDQEIIFLGINMPIADWGKTKARTEIAKSNLELVNMNNEQERTNFEQEIRLKVNQIQLKKDGVKIAQRANEASNKRFDLSTQRYLIGKISITELNQAIEDQNKSRQAYFNALRDFWVSYFEIRRLTLYDFIERKELVHEQK